MAPWKVHAFVFTVPRKELEGDGRKSAKSSHQKSLVDTPKQIEHNLCSKSKISQ